MSNKESISNSVDLLIGSTIRTINSIFLESSKQFNEIQKLIDEINNEKNNNAISEQSKKNKIQYYLTLSKNFNDNLNLIYSDIEKNRAYFKSESAEEK